MIQNYDGRRLMERLGVRVPGMVLADCIYVENCLSQSLTLSTSAGQQQLYPGRLRWFRRPEAVRIVDAPAGVRAIVVLQEITAYGISRKRYEVHEPAVCKMGKPA